MPTTPKELYIEAKNSKDTSSEPALSIGMGVPGVIILLGSVIALIFPDMNVTLRNTLLGVAGVLIPTITSILIRRKVWSPQSVRLVLEEAERVAKSQYTNSEKYDMPRKLNKPPLGEGF